MPNLPRLVLPLLTCGAAMMFATIAAAATTPASSLSDRSRTGAALAIVLGGIVLPCTCLVGAAREDSIA